MRFISEFLAGRLFFGPFSKFQNKTKNELLKIKMEVIFQNNIFDDNIFISIFQWELRFLFKFNYRSLAPLHKSTTCILYRP